MQNQYETDEKANNYERFRKTSLFFKYISRPSLIKILGGDLTGKRCIDMACGSGHSTRLLVDMNALDVVGVDLSQKMIDFAMQQDSSHPKYSAIQYLVKDCSQPLGLGQFDVVSSIHFLNYAETQDKLASMVKTMFDSTRPGGICAGMIINPFVDPKNFSKLLKYGLKYELNGHELNTELYEGHVENGRVLIHFVTYLWEPHVHERCFRAAGFTDFEWVKVEVDNNYDDKSGYFDDFIQVAPNIMFKAMKSVQ